MRRKLFFTFLFSLLTAMCLSQWVYANDYSGSCGSNTTWDLDTSTGVLTISGNGIVDDYGYPDYSPWYKYKDTITTIVVNEGVTRIGGNSFFDCSNITSVKLPTSLITIGYKSFCNCISLQCIEIPTNCKEIEFSAFSYCSSLSKIIIPASVTTIWDEVFLGCNNLKTAGPIGGGYNYEFGWNYKIPRNAFYNCESFEYLTIPETVYSLNDVFDGSYSLKTAGPIGGGYDYEFGWTDEIPEDAFECLGYSSVVYLPSTITNINAVFPAKSTVYFGGTKSEWNEISISSGNNNVFDLKIFFPDEVHTHDYSKYQCSICGIRCGECGENIKWYIDDNRLIIFGEGKIIGEGDLKNEFPWENQSQSLYFNELEIKEGITDISTLAFNECKSLKTVVLPNGIKEISSLTFGGCEIEKFVFLGDAPQMGILAFSNMVAKVYYPMFNDTWNTVINNNYGGDITWVSNFNGLINANEYFTDIILNKWSIDGINYVVSYGYMKGTSGTLFNQTGTMSRSMVVTVLYRIAGQPASTVENPFNDIEKGWYYNAVLWAYENGIVTGTSNTTFAPDNDVTREQMATFLYRFADYMGYNTDNKVNLKSFPDEGKVGSWAKEALAWANANGLISGSKGNDGVTRLDPQGKATREQVATILMRFCKAFNVNE